MMQRYCIDRHNGCINAVFVDFSTHRVGLKELWTLKRHRQFKTSSTHFGDWPGWMQNFKNY